MKRRVLNKGFDDTRIVSSDCAYSLSKIRSLILKLKLVEGVFAVKENEKNMRE